MIEEGQELYLNEKGKGQVRTWLINYTYDEDRINKILSSQFKVSKILVAGNLHVLDTTGQAFVLNEDDFLPAIPEGGIPRDNNFIISVGSARIVNPLGGGEAYLGNVRPTKEEDLLSKDQLDDVINSHINKYLDIEFILNAGFKPIIGDECSVSIFEFSNDRGVLAVLSKYQDLWKLEVKVNGQEILTMHNTNYFDLISGVEFF